MTLAQAHAVTEIDAARGTTPCKHELAWNELVIDATALVGKAAAKAKAASEGSETLDEVIVEEDGS